VNILTGHLYKLSKQIGKFRSSVSHKAYILQPAGNESREYAALERQAVCKVYNQFETSYLYIAALHANCPAANSDHSLTLAADVRHLYINRLGFPA